MSSAALAALAPRAARKLSAERRCVSAAADHLAALSDHTTPPPAAFDAVVENLLGAYLERTPTAVRAVHLLQGRAAHSVHADHVAMRAFVDSNGASGLAFLHDAFVAAGYAPQPDITIPSLPVNARWFEPPAQTGWPKIFCSELRTRELPPAASRIIYKHIDGYYDARGRIALGAALAALRGGDGATLTALLDEPPWRPSWEDVQLVRSLGQDAALRAAAEYASWTLTQGHRVNHVAILQNVLGLEHAGVVDLQSLNALLQENGMVFNPAGGSDGWTQGSVAVHLEQSSTLADHISHEFSCGAVKDVPCAFLELVQRHDGFPAFLGQNAQAIFASTHSRTGLGGARSG